MLTIRIPVMFFERRKNKFVAKVEQNGAIRTLVTIAFDDLSGDGNFSWAHADFTQLAKDAAVITLEPVDDRDVTSPQTKLTRPSSKKAAGGGP